MLGLFSKTTDSNFIEATGLSGMDFIILDQEHGTVNSERLLDHIRASKVGNLMSLVRVPYLNANYIGKSLDAGADGVMIPNISSPEEASLAIEYAKFYPLGNRGVCRFVKAADFGIMDKEKYFKTENKKLIILQIEGEKGIENIDDILQIQGYDYIFIGPYDLSQSLGLPGDIFHEKVLAEISKIILTSKQYGKKVGIFTDTQHGLRMYEELGVELIAFSVDINIYIEALKSIKWKK